jgi:hypothetical protein
MSVAVERSWAHGRSAMSTRWWRIIFDNATGLYIAGAVALGAIAAASLALNGGLPGLAAAVMRPQSVEAPWTEAIRVVDEALAAGDVSAAGRAWTEAYNAAQRSRRWEGLARPISQPSGGPVRKARSKACCRRRRHSIRSATPRLPPRRCGLPRRWPDGTRARPCSRESPRCARAGDLRSRLLAARTRGSSSSRSVPETLVI